MTSTSAPSHHSGEKTAPIPKPLTITLPATSHKPTRSITDILRELKKPTTPPAAIDPSAAVEAPAVTRFAGGTVAYSSSALASEAAAFAAAIADSNIPSQPSPPTAPSTAEPLVPATSPHPPTTPHA